MGEQWERRERMDGCSVRMSGLWGEGTKSTEVVMGINAKISIQYGSIGISERCLRLRLATMNC